MKPIIQVVPGQIQFSARSSKATERLIMLRSGDGRAFEILSAKLESGEGAVEIKKLAESRWQLKLTVVPDSLPVGLTVQVETSCKGQPKIVIPLSLR